MDKLSDSGQAGAQITETMVELAAQALVIRLLEPMGYCRELAEIVLANVYQGSIDQDLQHL